MRIRAALSGIGGLALLCALSSAPAAGNDGPRVAERPFTLTASALTLSGAAYHGVVEVPTRNGSKPAMRFTVTGLRITDLVQTAEFGDARTLRLSARPGSTTTASDGTIELYTERLSGRLAGIPVEFTPDLPPPAALPVMRFTDVTVQNAALRGGTLRIPGASLELR